MAGSYKSTNTAGTGGTLEDCSPLMAARVDSLGDCALGAGTGEAVEEVPSHCEREKSRASSQASTPRSSPRKSPVPPPLKFPQSSGEAGRLSEGLWAPHAGMGTDVVLAPSAAWQVPQEPLRDDFSKLALERQLREYALRCDTTHVEELLQAGTSANVAHRGGPGESRYVAVLHSVCNLSCAPGGAVQPGSLEVAGLLLKARADVNPRCSEGCTPLMRACRTKNAPLAQLLLDWRADILAVDDLGVDPLKYALVLDPRPTAQNVSPDADAPDLQLPGHISATKHGGSGCDGGGLGGRTLRPASGDGSVSAELVRVLLESGPPQAVRKVLRLADEEAKEGASSSGVSAPRRKSSRPKRVSNAVDTSPMSKNITVTRSPAEDFEKDTVQRKNQLAKESPLMTAVRMLNHQAADVLITVGGVQAMYLHEAIRSRSVALVKTLCNGQADPGAQDSNGDSAMDVALELQDHQILDALREVGASSPNVPSQPLLRSDFARPSSSSSSPQKKHRRMDGSKTLDFGCHLSNRGEDGVRFAPTCDQATTPFRRFVLRVLTFLGLVSLFSRLEELLQPYAARLGAACLRTCSHKSFQTFQFVLLVLGLTISDMWVVVGVQGDSGLDALLTAILFGFVCELLVQAAGIRKPYLTSFFFYMDIVGACSLVLDMSLFRDFIGAGGGVSDNAVIMRAARAARLGARAGRFTRLVKLLRFLPGFKAPAESAGTAKVITSRLITKLSMLVSCLIIVLAMVLPLFNIFTYPFQDYSMSMLVKSLDALIEHHGNSTTELHVKEFIADFRGAFSDKLYYPHSCYHKHLDVSRLLFSSRGQVQPRNVLSVKHGAISVVFDFGGANQAESGANLAMILAIVSFMVGFSLVLSKSVSRIAMLPLEQIMSQVRALTSTIYDQADLMYMSSMYKAKAKNEASHAPAAEFDGEMGDEEHIAQETALLEKVVKKIATLGEILMRHERPADLITLEYLGEATPVSLVRTQANNDSGGDHVASPLERGSLGSISFEEAMRGALTDDPLDEDLKALESWNFDALKVDRVHSFVICFKILKAFSGKVSRVSEDVLHCYVDSASAGYKNAQYHNWLHAVDVTHVLFLLFHKCSRQGALMSPLEEYALLASAVCHDIGHPGVNNDFLVKTSSELAICYNDVSPLENMHCARMFEIAMRPRSAIFGELSKEQYADVRGICVAAVLHTDNMHHLPMVKKLQLFGEVHTELLQQAQETFQKRSEAICEDDSDPGVAGWPTKELAETLWERENRELLRNLIFHFADINNTTRPFVICKEWAILVLEEFFAQGDLEKQRGLPVGPLNDREKLNRPFSQIGFIDFFAAPFVFATVRILSPLQELAEQLTSNFGTWIEEWIDEEPRADEEVTKIRARLAGLQERSAALKLEETRRGSLLTGMKGAKTQKYNVGRRHSVAAALMVRASTVNQVVNHAQEKPSGSPESARSMMVPMPKDGMQKTSSGRLGKAAFTKRMSFRNPVSP